MISDYNYTTLAKICNKSGSFLGKDKYEYVISCVPYLKSWIDNILLFDAIINNHDRHLNNFTVKITGNRVDPCLCYDFGDSLFSTLKEAELKKVFDMPLNYTQSKPFGSVHNAQLQFIGNSSLQPLNSVNVYKTVNRYLNPDRAKWINKWIVLKLKELNLVKKQT